jgi:hypothetical protein
MVEGLPDVDQQGRKGGIEAANVRSNMNVTSARNLQVEQG